MTINLLTETRKKLNSIFIVSFLTFALCWLIIFPTLFFGSSDSNIVGILIFISGIFLLISILSAVINATLVKRLDLSINTELRLSINTNLSNKEITKTSDIEYARNFLNVDNIIYEIDNKQAYELYRTKIVSNIETKYHQTKLLEFSPKEFFNTIMDMLWAAS